MKFRCKDSDHKWDYVQDPKTQGVIRVCTGCKFRQRQMVGRTGPESRCWITAEV